MSLLVKSLKEPLTGPRPQSRTEARMIWKRAPKKYQAPSHVVSRDLPAHRASPVEGSPCPHRPDLLEQRSRLHYNLPRLDASALQDLNTQLIMSPKSHLRRLRMKIMKRQAAALHLHLVDHAPRHPNPPMRLMICQMWYRMHSIACDPVGNRVKWPPSPLRGTR